MMFGLLDNETGKVVFQTDGHFTRETKLEKQAKVGREFPKTSRYLFQNGDGKEVDFSVAWVDEIETRDMTESAPEAMKRQFDAMNVAPVYMRYYAKGTAVFADPSNHSRHTSAGDMIYEYAYLGRPDGRARV